MIKELKNSSFRFELLAHLINITFAILFIHENFVRPSDFAQDYASAYNLVHSLPIYGDAHRQTVQMLTPFERADSFHPPAAALFHVPFIFLEHDSAINLYRVCSAIFYLLALHFFLLSAQIRGRANRILCSMSLLWYPLLEGLSMGNVSVWVGGAILLAVAALKSNRDISAGMLLGLATSLKLYPLLFLPGLFLMRRQKAAYVMLLSCVMIYLLTLFYVGEETLVTYISMVSKKNIDIFVGYPGTISLSAVVMRIFRANQWAENLINLPVNPEILACVITGGLSLIALVSLKVRNLSLESQLALLILTALLATPVGWSHSLLIIPPAILYVCEKSQISKFDWTAILLLFWPIIPIYRTVYTSLNSQPLSFGLASLMYIPCLAVLYFYLKLLVRKVFTHEK